MVSTSTHPVTIGMDTYAVAGTLFLPVGASPEKRVPGVLIAAGPDPLPQVRYPEQGGENWTMQWAKHLAGLGLAVLVYDQRGGGLSTGEYHAADRDELFHELLNVADMLRAQPEVDGARVAALGWGEGAAFALQLAQRGDVSAAVLLAAPYHTAEERYTHSIRSLAQRNGLSERVVGLRVQMWRDQMARTAAQVEAGVHTTTTEVGDQQVTTNLKRFVQNQAFNPKELVVGLTTPLLLLHGAADNLIPATESAELQAALESSGLAATRKVYPGVEHFLYRQKKALQDAGEWLQRTLLP